MIGQMSEHGVPWLSIDCEKENELFVYVNARAVYFSEI